MRNDDKLLLEVLDEALRILPPNVPSFTKLTKYEPISSLRRKPRADAHGLKARRSTGARKWESWVDVQTISLTQEND
jgi:hypothetical protein